MPLTNVGLRDRLSMSCDIETRLPTPRRRQRLHAECDYPHCTCKEHERDGQEQR